MGICRQLMEPTSTPFVKSELQCNHQWWQNKILRDKSWLYWCLGSSYSWIQSNPSWSNSVHFIYFGPLRSYSICSVLFHPFQYNLVFSVHLVHFCPFRLLWYIWSKSVHFSPIRTYSVHSNPFTLVGPIRSISVH